MTPQSAQKPEAVVPDPGQAPDSMLMIDRFLPRYDFAVVHASVFQAPPEVCYQAARGLDLLRDPVIRTLLGLRSLPQRLADRLGEHRAGPAEPAPTFRLDDMLRYDWILLSEELGVEIVLGQIGRPWKPVGASSGPSVEPAGFAAFDQPGFAKIAFSLGVQPYGTTSSIVTMDTRIVVTDPKSRQRFARYWTLVEPFVRLIDRMTLRLLGAELRRLGRKDGTHGDQPIPLVERIRTRIEHEVDTRSVGVGAWLLRLTKGRIVRPWHRQALILATSGRRSGLERTVPLQFFPDGDDMIVVAANSGLPSPPGWYFNLTANPRARVEVGDRTLVVRAEELTADEAAAFWPRVLQVAPDYARYPKRTSRRIALIRLVPVTTMSSVTTSKPSASAPGSASGQQTEHAPTKT
jgi:deazaflavin-dependent oxidoreductase (nitroreductase family)